MSMIGVYEKGMLLFRISIRETSEHKSISSEAGLSKMESDSMKTTSREEIAEIVTHAAFYCGWPKAWAVFRMAKEVWAEDK